ncbi:MAG: heme o synthase [Actinomycetota bacterium]
MALLRRLSTATAISTLALVAIGGVVRATGSGDACPDWPRCFGRYLPPLEFHTLIEYSHRLAAAITGLLILITAWVAWRRERRDPAVLWPIVVAVGVVLVQAAIGRLRIVGGARAAIVTLHFLVAMGLVALVMMTAAATRLRRPDPGQGDPTVDHGFRRLAWWTLAATLLLLAVGAYVRGEGAGLVFLDWPLMDGRLVPYLETNGTVAAFVHRLLAAIVVVMGGVLAWRARRVAHRGVRALAWLAFGLLVVQAGLGAAAVLTELSAPAVAGHVAGSSLAWAALVATVAAAGRMRVRPDESPAPRPRAGERVAAYLQLAKPDIIVLLLITTVPAMVLAAEGMPPVSLILATLLGGSLAAAGANAVNCYLDRDIDEVMARTRGRPLPSHRVEPGEALRFGWIAIATAFAWLAATVNLLAATLTAAAALFYVFVYTAWMKRSTPQNIVIGGAAGAVPALVGWAAVTETVTLPALVLFALVFLWTPPHFWALAIRHAGDYRAAGVPMLPAVRGRRATALHIGVYAVLVVATSLALVPAAGLGPLYVGSATALGALFLAHAVRVWRDASTRAAMALFRYSITYLALLFVAAAADQLVRG